MWLQDKLLTSGPNKRLLTVFLETSLTLGPAVAWPTAEDVTRPVPDHPGDSESRVPRISSGLVAEKLTAESGTRPDCCCCWIFPGPAGRRIAAECVTRFGCSETSSRKHRPFELLCWAASCRERHLAQLLRRQQPTVSPVLDAGRVAAEGVTWIGCCAAHTRGCHSVRMLDG